METIQFLAAPFVLALLLVGIHCYLGLHVLERDVIFVDISLSQVAALGAAVSLFFKSSEDGEILPLLTSFLFCFLVALFLAFLRRNEKSVSQESVIGMTYAIASGALILVADRLPHGTEHLKQAMVGNILFITWNQVFITMIIYVAIGAIHWFLRDQFWRASRQKNGVFAWDFFFYFLFGIVITFSTQHAGVLVVFSILVAPAALASRLFKELKTRLLVSWVTGTIGILSAFYLSYRFDMPAGPTIVCLLTGLFFLSLAIRPRET